MTPNSEPQSPQAGFCAGLLRRRQIVVPTWRGWLALLVLGAGLLVFGMRTIHPFLAQVAPLPGGLLVIEGWAPDYAMEEAVAEFRRNHYDHLYVTGGPIEAGAPLSQYRTYAELGAATLLKLGLSTNEVRAVPAPLVRRDRTYNSAVALNKWLCEQGIPHSRVHLMTEGPHARRSRVLFQYALGKEVSVGVTAVAVRDYDPRHWWRSSAGVRGVTGEALAYLYARFLFSPERD